MSAHGPQVLKAYQKASILLLCAHRWEAQPFLQALELRPGRSSLPFEVFANESGWLLGLTGAGGYRAAATTASLLAHCPTDSGRFLVCNFGLAGGYPKQTAIGEGFLLHRVSDEASGHSFYPERGVRTPWPETRAVCVTAPAWGKETPEQGATGLPLYDMESYGVCAASEQFLPNSHWLLGKVVSDFVTSDTRPDWSLVTRTVKNDYTARANEFVEIILKQYAFLVGEPRAVRMRETQPWSERLKTVVSERLRLTVNQEQQLSNALLSYALQHSSEQRDQARLEIERLLGAYEGSGKSDRARAHRTILAAVGRS